MTRVSRRSLGRQGEVLIMRVYGTARTLCKLLPMIGMEIEAQGINHYLALVQKVATVSSGSQSEERSEV